MARRAQVAGHARKLGVDAIVSLCALVVCTCLGTHVLAHLLAFMTCIYRPAVAALALQVLMLRRWYISLCCPTRPSRGDDGGRDARAPKEPEVFEFVHLLHAVVRTKPGALVAQFVQLLAVAIATMQASAAFSLSLDSSAGILLTSSVASFLSCGAVLYVDASMRDLLRTACSKLYAVLSNPADEVRLELEGQFDELEVLG